MTRSEIRGNRRRALAHQSFALTWSQVSMGYVLGKLLVAALSLFIARAYPSLFF